MTNNLWNDDTIQFPRLLAEIVATIDFSENDIMALCETMDLTITDINQLFDRAQNKWELIKSEI